MNLNRRNFLLSSFAAAGCLLLPPPLAAIASLLGKSRDGRRLVLAGRGAIYILDIPTQELTKIPVDFLGHGFARAPKEEGKVWVLERMGSAAVEVDLKQKSISRRLECPAGFAFYGHGSFSADGGSFALTGVERATGRGHLFVYDAKKATLRANWPIAPGYVHDCAFDGRNTILVSSHGLVVTEERADGTYRTGPRLERPSLLTVDVKNGKVLDQRFFEDEGQVSGHFLRQPSGDVVFVTMPWNESIANDPKTGKGAIYHCRPGGPIQRVQLPAEVQAKIRGGMLSLSFDPREKVVGITNPGGGVVIFVDGKSGAYRGHFDLDALGLAYFPETKKFLYNPRSEKLVYTGNMGGSKELFYRPADGTASFEGMHLFVI